MPGDSFLAHSVLLTMELNLDTMRGEFWESFNSNRSHHGRGPRSRARIRAPILGRGLARARLCAGTPQIRGACRACHGRGAKDHGARVGCVRPRGDRCSCDTTGRYADRCADERSRDDPGHRGVDEGAIREILDLRGRGVALVGGAFGSETQGC